MKNSWKHSVSYSFDDIVIVVGKKLESWDTRRSSVVFGIPASPAEKFRWRVSVLEFADLSDFHLIENACRVKECSRSAYNIKARLNIVAITVIVSKF